MSKPRGLKIMPPTQYRVTTLPHAFFWSSNLSATYLFNLVQLVNFKTTYGYESLQV